MRKNVFSVFLIVCLSAGLLCCSQPGASSSPVQPVPILETFKVENLILDYDKGFLSFESNAPNKSLVTLVTNGQSFSSKSLAGKTQIQVVGNGRLINSEYDAGNIYSGYLKCDAYNNLFPVKFSYFPHIYIKEFEGYSSTLSRISDFDKENFFPTVKSNYGNVKCEMVWEYYYTSALPSILDDSFSGFKIENGIEGVKEFVKDSSNAGLFIVGKCILNAKTVDSETITTNTYCSWNIVDVDVPDSMEITSKNNINFYVSFYKGSDLIDSEGSLIWYADGIECGNGKTYVLRKEDLGKKLSCKFFGLSSLSCDYSKKLFAPIKSATVSYNGVEVLKGKTLYPEAITIRAVKDYFDNDLNPNNAVCLPEICEEYGTKEEGGITIPLLRTRIGTFDEWSQVKYEKTDWTKVYVKYSENDGLEEPFSTLMFVPVKYELSDDLMPFLSTDVNNISYGKVRFSGLKTAMSYRLSDKNEWIDFDYDTEIACSAGDTINVRVRETGAFGSDYYVIESDSKEIIVKEENIGKLYDVSGINVAVKNEVIGIKLISNTNNIFVFEADIPDSLKQDFDTNSSLINFKWQTNNYMSNVENYYSYSADKRTFTVDASNWASDNYDVILTVVRNDNFYTTELKSFKVR